MSEAEIDRQVAAFRKAPDDDHSSKSDAKVVFKGLSEQALIPLLYAAIAVGLLGLVAALIVGLVVMTQVGSISATANNAVNLAMMSERNAKLAQYQLELALKRANIEVPTDLTEKQK